MQLMKIAFSWLVILGLASCSVPGVYMGAAGVNTPAKYHGSLIKPKIIPITSEVLAAQHPYTYRVGPYDVLSIIVWDHPELTMPTVSTKNALVDNDFSSMVGIRQQQNVSGIVVDRQGYIFFPYAGRFKVAGLTVNRIRIKLVRRLARYIRHPQVSVRVVGFRSKQLSVIGEVLHPGLQSITDRPLTLLNAINTAGGVNPISADTSHVYVIRNQHGRAVVYWIDAKSPQKMLFAEQFVLKPADIIYVSPAGVASWNRIVSQILPTVQTIWYTHNLVSQ